MPQIFKMIPSVLILSVGFIFSGEVLNANNPKNLKDENSISITSTIPEKKHIVLEEQESLIKAEHPQCKLSLSEKAEYNLRGIALFSGKSAFSRLIKRFTQSDYSHVGVVFSKAGENPDDESAWRFFEATISPKDIILERHFPHVRLSPWTQVVEHYDGSVFLRTFKFENDNTPPSQAVTQFVEKFNGRPYEKHLTELIRAAYGSNKKVDLSSVFCSELTAEMFMELGLMPPSNANNYVPKHFSTESSIKLVGASLSREMIVKKAKQSRWCCIL
ncbi:hypothetical protein Bealeia1_01890 [Candidatus Bealeia paramacronuclearis]|uniref:Permuted papain-like amidase YaeF/Yiix C92 family enzyme n=1 Tax=Candidatus Bealeia paramacronuclearis TaxID=1921001 RepID=A0ABZ2C5A8_9PROT|nr:hypothetical protein [Candidatus Bealeia paramacronuclearis]MEB3702763.1 hypothetical protein [Candidatus Bealeia paramacronuclearis]